MTDDSSIGVFPMVPIEDSDRKKSSFESILEERWMKAPLWYSLKDLRTECIEGTYGFIKQLNVDRSQKRRRPENIQNVDQAFNSDSFNFTKISGAEILFRLNEDDLIVSNVAPLEHCHSLVIPSVKKCLPQILTREGLELTLKFMFASSSPDLRGGFNSLGGFASVNHQHLHIYYLRHRMLLETVSVHKLSEQIAELSEYPAKGLLFHVTHDDFTSLNKFFQVIQMLLDNKISHNVFITRGTIPGACYFARPTTYEVIRIYLWARENYFGIKRSEDFNIALAELSGHITLKSEEAFASVNEHLISERLRETCDKPFNRMIDLLKENKFI